MSEIYNIYESSFKSLSKNIESAININEYSQKSLTKLRTDIQEINRILKQMNLEINNLKLTKNKIPKQIESNLKQYREQVNSYNNQLVRIQENFYKNNNKNKDNKNILVDEETNCQQQELIDEEYNEQKNKLNKIEKDCYYIEQLGGNIEEGLNQQGEKMKGIRDNIFEMKKDADMSNKLVNDMISKTKRNKILFYGGAVVLVVIFGLLVYFKKF